MKKRILSIITAAAIGTSGLIAINSDKAEAGKKDKEKCYGVSKKGANDCGTKTHSCAGYADKDNDPAEWIYVPKGLCERLTNGSLESSE